VKIKEVALHRLHARIRPVLLGIAVLVSASISFASGFSIFEQGAKATGMGGAFAATADDPSAIFYNVAGIAYQRQLSVMTGGTSITFDNQFTGGTNSDYPGGGVKEFYRGHIFVVPNLYAVVPIGQNLTFGLGTFGAYGLRTDWANPGTYSGRFISQDANIKTISVQPSLAWKTSNDVFAIGVGAEYRRSHISLERNLSLPINPFTLRITDIAHARLNSDWNNAWGYDVGLMFRPNKTWSLGLNYRSDMDIDYKGTAKFHQISTGIPPLDAAIKAGLPPDQDISTTVSFPATISLGIATTMCPTWRVEFDAVRATWSNFKSLDIDFKNASTPDLHIDENWRDTWSWRIGANHPVTDRWDVRLGAVYDENPQPLSGVGPLLPDADRVGPSFGLGYHGSHFSVDATELFLVFMKRDTAGKNVNNYNGTYKTTANLFAVNLGYHF
jgi:long-chain fatty acid transport protein